MDNWHIGFKNKAMEWGKFLFGGIGIILMQFIWDNINKNTIVNDVMNAYIKSSIVFIGIIIAIRWLVKSNLDKYKVKIEQLESVTDELTNSKNELEIENDGLMYKCKNYENLEDFYKKISSIVDLNQPIDDSFINGFISQIEHIVLETTSSSVEKIYVSVFEEELVSKRTKKYRIVLSNYHSIGTIKKINFDKKSFVAKIFKLKESLYIEDIDLNDSNRMFDDNDKCNREFHTILGIPYVVNDKCKYSIIITAKKAGSLAEINENYIDLLRRYTQVVGYLMLMKSYLEERKNV